MNYSRRQLESFGEPFGASATQTKPEGRGRIYGGGGSTTTTPTSTTINQTSIPEYARPYVEKTLGEAGSLTDINANPYQAYGGERYAQFTPMQQQSFSSAANMQTSPQTQTATNLAGAAGVGALNAAGSFNPYQTGQFYGSTASDYMSPYMQNVVGVQQQEAARQAGIAGTQQQSQATKSGAFGGGRDAIMRAENARNLATQQGGIQAQGLQSAYQSAMDQFNREQQMAEQSKQFGAGFGMQGLQTALQGAGQLGALGQQDYSQQMGITGLQNQMGTQQQGQVQNVLTGGYQDYLNAQQDPFKKLSFMSDILRGGPLSQTYSQQYTAGPSTAQTLGSLGTAAYGLSKMAGGGIADANNMITGGGNFANPSEPVTYMAAGGSSVTDPSFVESKLKSLSTPQLQKVKQDALARQNVDLANNVDAILAQRAEAASFTSGLASAAPANMEEMLPTEVSARNGGILSFADGTPDPDADATEMRFVSDDTGGGENPTETNIAADEDTSGTAPVAVGRGNKKVYDEAASMGIGALRRIAGAKYIPMTAAEEKAVDTEYRSRVQQGTEKDPYAKRLTQLTQDRATSSKEFEQDKGMAILQAAGAMMQGHGLAAGLGHASTAFAGAYGAALKAKRAQKQAEDNMEFHLMDSQRKERMGLNKDAAAAVAAARKASYDAQMFKVKADENIGKLAPAIMRYSNPAAGPAAKAIPFDLQAVDTRTQQLLATDKTGTLTPLAAKNQAFKEIYGMKNMPLTVQQAQAIAAANAGAIGMPVGTPEEVKERVNAMPVGGGGNTAPQRLRFDAQGNPI